MTIIMQQGDPSGPVLVQQLKSAGFNVVFQALQDAAHNDAMAAGNFDLALGVHCGSVYDPWQTLEHFHGKYAAAPGPEGDQSRAPTRDIRTRSSTRILDKMEAMTPSPKNEAYMKLVRDATAIFLRDLPEITLGRGIPRRDLQQHTTGPASRAQRDPYVAPYLPWEGFNLIVHRLKPRS